MASRENNDKKIRVDPQFNTLLKDISRQRIKNDIDKEFRGTRELTKMMINAPSMDELLKDMTEMPTKKDFKKMQEGMF